MPNKKIKLIFLDIDGVFNYEMFYLNRGNDNRTYPLSEFDKECVKRYNRIIKETNAKTVISSSWRFDVNLKNILRKVGFCDESLDFDMIQKLKIIALLMMMWTCYIHKRIIL